MEEGPKGNWEEAIRQEGQPATRRARDTTAVDENGQVTFSVQVQAPTWMDVDEARLLENGEVVQTLTPDPAGDGVIRVDTVVTVEPSADAWYAVEVSGSGSLAPVAFDGTPYAVTNAIEVDVDGDGIWTPPKG